MILFEKEAVYKMYSILVLHRTVFSKNSVCSKNKFIRLCTFCLIHVKRVKNFMVKNIVLQKHIELVCTWFNNNNLLIIYNKLLNTKVTYYSVLISCLDYVVLFTTMFIRIKN